MARLVRSVREISPDDAAIMLAYAQKVIVVPGYGLAVAQAQHAVRELAELLEVARCRGRRTPSIPWRAACPAT